MAMLIAGDKRSSTLRLRARILIFVGSTVDLAAAGLLLGHMATLHPTIRSVEWPTAAARAAIFLVPAVVALLALRKGPALLGAAIILNFATLIVVPESLFVGPIILMAMLPFLFAWNAMRDETKKAWTSLVIAAFGVAAAIVLAVGPQRNVDFSILSRGGRVVEAHATVIASCPSSESGSFTGEGVEQLGCDPIVDARSAEVALVLSGMALVAATLHGMTFRGTAAARAR